MGIDMDTPTDQPFVSLFTGGKSVDGCMLRGNFESFCSFVKIMQHKRKAS